MSYNERLSPRLVDCVNTRCYNGKSPGLHRSITDKVWCVVVHKCITVSSITRTKARSSFYLLQELPALSLSVFLKQTEFAQLSGKSLIGPWVKTFLLLNVDEQTNCFSFVWQKRSHRWVSCFQWWMYALLLIQIVVKIFIICLLKIR